MPSLTSAGAALRGASVLVALQVLSRLLTFAANQVLLRFLTAPLLGVATQLEVYYLSVLFFARESLRVAVLRQGDVIGDGDDVGEEEKMSGAPKPSRAATSAPKAPSRTAIQSQSIANIAHLSLPIGLLSALLLGLSYLRLAGASSSSILSPTTPLSLPAAVKLYALSATLELLAEPAFAVLASRMVFAPRALAEGVGAVARCVVALGSAVWLSDDTRSEDGVGLLPFAAGQLAYSTVLLAVYLWSGLALSRKEGWSLLVPRAIRISVKEGRPAVARSSEFAGGYLYRPTLVLAGSLVAQSVFKHFLTQGDTLLVSFLAPDPTEQGVYALANNYGGLLARLLFQPVEESSRLWFGRVLTEEDVPPAKKEDEPKSAKTSPNSEPPQTTPEVTPKPPRTPAYRAATVLSHILRLYLTLLCLPLVAVASSACPPLLQLVAGRTWTLAGAGDVLAAYATYYLPLLAINGVAEAFVAAAADANGLARQSRAMLLFSVVFAGAGLALVRWGGIRGATALVLANALAMACRISWSLAFAQGYFKARGVEYPVLNLLKDHQNELAIAPKSSNFIGMVGAAGMRGVILKGPVEDMHIWATLVALLKAGMLGLIYVAVLISVEFDFLLKCYRIYVQGLDV